MSMTFIEVNSKKLNHKYVRELEKVNFDNELIYESFEKAIRNIKTKTGKALVKTKANSMVSVYKALYRFLNKDFKNPCCGQCCPSMTRIATSVYTSIKLPNANDTAQEAKEKRKILNKYKMRVHRAIKMLAEAGFITIHQYRAETNMDESKLENFYYQLTPLSLLSEEFALEVKDYGNRQMRVIDKLETAINTIMPHMSLNLKDAKEEIRTKARNVKRFLVNFFNCSLPEPDIGGVYCES